jgi:hypothetical protein
VSYLYQIRICFDKNFTLIDCDGIKELLEPMTGKTNCPLNTTITYPGVLPPAYEQPVYITTDHQHSWLLEAWQITQFLQWMTMKIYPIFL